VVEACPPPRETVASHKTECAKPFHDPTPLDFNVPFPHTITMAQINMTDIRTIWRQGISTLEQVFQEHITRMNMEFEAKLTTFDAMRDGMQCNFEFMEGFYHDMQGKLECKNEEILVERQNWECHKDVIKDMVNLDSEVVSLNVGGTHHLKTERDVLRLCKGSLLEEMFNGMHTLKVIDNEYFLDRDGTTFLHLLNFLRNSREVLPEFTDHNDEIHFYKELQYWRIETKYGMTVEQYLYKLENAQRATVRVLSQERIAVHREEMQSKNHVHEHTASHTMTHSM